MDRTYESHVPIHDERDYHTHHEYCRSSRGLPVGSIRCTCRELFDKDEKVKEYALLRAKYTRLEIFAVLYGSDELKDFLKDLETWKMVKDAPECGCDDCNLPRLGEEE